MINYHLIEKINNYIGNSLDQFQLEATTCEYPQIIVGASAGSGKTAVTVARIIYLLLSKKMRIEQVIAITFTEKAASELYIRLKTAILAFDELKDQVDNLDLALITTIDGLANQIAKKFYYLIPNQKVDLFSIANIIDQAKISTVIAQSLEQVLEKYYLQNQDSFLQFINLYSKDNLVKLIISLLNHKVTADYFKLDAKEDYVKLMTYYQKEINQVINEINQLEEKQVLTALEFVDNSIDQINQGILDFLSINNGKRMQDSLSKDMYKELRDNLEKNFKLSADLKLETEIINQNLNFLQQIYLEVVQLFQDYKLNHKLVEFQDRLQFAIEILRNLEVQEYYRDHFKYLFVDEFQDTSLDQMELLKLLGIENKFYVGDLKQSIYRFRGAKVEIMRKLISDPSFKFLSMKNNYRSNHRIVKFNNNLFYFLLNNNYSKANLFKLEDDVATSPQFQTVKDGEIIYYALDQDPDDKTSEDELKALFIAYKIQQMVDDKLAKYKDCGIIAANNKQLSTIKKALDFLSIPTNFSDKKAFFNHSLIKDILVVIELLDDFNNKYLRAKYLLSHFTDYNTEDLLDGNLIDTYFKLDNPLTSLYHQLNCLTIMEVIQSLYQINDFYQRYYCLELDQFLQIVSLYQHSDDISFSDFNHYLLNLKQQDLAAGSLFNSEDDAVALMSIHSSKGLEFKNLFFFSESKQVKAHSNFLIRDKLYLKVYQKDLSKYQSTSYTLAQELEELDELNERLRVLYVALTRAADNLYIVAKKSIESKNNVYHNQKYLFSKKYYNDFIFWSFYHQDSLMTRYYFYRDSQFEDENKNIWTIKPQAQITSNQTMLVSRLADRSYTISQEYQLPKFDSTRRGKRLHKFIELIFNADLRQSNSMQLSKFESLSINKLLNNSFFNQIIENKNLIKYFEYPILANSRMYYLDLLVIDSERKEIMIIDFKLSYSDEESMKKRYQSQLRTYYQILKHKYSDYHFDLKLINLKNANVIDIEEE